MQPTLRYLAAVLLFILLLLFPLAWRGDASQAPLQDNNVGEPFEPTYRNFVNNALAAIASNESGLTAPINPWTGESWYNTGNGTINFYNGSSWVTFTPGGGGGGGGSSSGPAGTVQTGNGSGGFSSYGGTTVPSHNFMNGLTSLGVANYAQPADTDLALSDNTTNNVSASNHGFTPKLPNDSTKFLNGTGAWTVPAGTGSGGGGPTVLDEHAGPPSAPYATQAASSTSTEYTLYSFSVPGGTLGTLGEVNLEAGLQYTNTVTADSPSIGVQYGSTDQTASISPSVIATGSNTAVRLTCKLKALGVATAETMKCDMFIGNSTGEFHSVSFSLAENSANSLAFAIRYQDPGSTNSTVKLLDVKLTSAS